MLTLNQAQAIAAAATAEAESLGMPVAVAVVDHCYGTVLALKAGRRQALIHCHGSLPGRGRSDGRGGEGIPGKSGGVALPGGGLPIHLSGRLAGGVGVCGAQPEANERVARAGLSALA